MKTRLFTFAALALALAACTNDNLNDGPVAAVINAEISDAVATRASGTAWAERDEIGISESRFGVTIFPSPRWLMLSFWQNTHRSPQPEKNTAPLPRVPLMQGSSHRCSAARAILGILAADTGMI